MDIKQALNSILPLQLRAKNKVEKSIKSDSTTDRDANGQQSFGGGQQHPPMSDEQLKKAMKHLEELAVVKEQNLTVEHLQVDSKNFVLLKDPTGKVIRRISEAELWTLQYVKETEKGQLIRKLA